MSFILQASLAAIWLIGFVYSLACVDFTMSGKPASLFDRLTLSAMWPVAFVVGRSK